MSLWTEPQYPGDVIRALLLYRGGHGRPIELGDVRIQAYGAQSFRIGAFLPGVSVCNPGDTPKTEPEDWRWEPTTFAADDAFDAYVQEAYESGWQNYFPEQHGALRR
jgi:hypothetical protein